MAEKRSETNKYPSKFGVSRWVTAHQWLAEMMCERRARQEKKGLPLQFWRAQPWGGIFRQQAAAAYRLMKRVDPEMTGTGARAVSRFLRSEGGKRIYSLAGAFLVPLIEQQHRLVLLEEEQALRGPPPEAPVEPTVRPPEKPREAFVSKESTLSKLRGLD